MKTEDKSVVSSATKKTDWDYLKSEYISTKISLRKLSEKYNIPFSNVQKTAKREDWNQMRNQTIVAQNQKVVEQIAEVKASNADKAMRIISKLMDKIEESIEVIPKGDMQALKQAVASVKDLKDMGVFEVITDSKDVEITFGQGAEDYAD